MDEILCLFRTKYQINVHLRSTRIATVRMNRLSEKMLTMPSKQQAANEHQVQLTVFVFAL